MTSVTSSNVGPPLMCSLCICFDAKPPQLCLLIEFQAHILKSKPKINAWKNAHMMPNNGS